MSSHLPPSVHIVDDDASVCRSLSRLIRQAGYTAHTSPSAEDFLDSLTRPQSRPACLIVDLHMPGLSGLELQSKLENHAATCPIIFISGNGNIPATVRAMKQGAVTFLAKPFDPQELLDAVGEAIRRHQEKLAAQAAVGKIRQRMGELTEREREVMSWIITGALNKQIAGELGIVEKTVKVHRARVLEKMGVHSVAELVRLCATVGFSKAV